MIFPEIQQSTQAGTEAVKEVKKETDDLISLLNEATEKKPDHSEPEPGIKFEVISEPQPEPAKEDFAPAPEPEPEPEPVKPPEPPLMSFSDEAELLIYFVDGLQTLTLPVLYQKSIFTEAERELLRKNKKEGKSLKKLQAENPELFQKYLDFDDLKENIPYTNNEVKMLKNPLEAVLKKYNYHAGPEFLLMGAFLAVSAPRFLPLFSKLG